MLSLVTGASSGIGLQYATQLARDYHSDILLVSNQQAELQQVAEQLHNDFGVQTIPHYADLSLPAYRGGGLVRLLQAEQPASGCAYQQCGGVLLQSLLRDEHEAH